MEKENIDFDIASLSVFNPQILGDLKTLKQKRIIYGSQSESGIAFYNKQFTGVTKKTNEISPHPDKNKYSTTEEIRTVRQEMKFIAAEISKIILEKKD